MLTKRILYVILTFTLVLQLFPTNNAGRFLMLDLPDDEYSDMAGAKTLRQFVEEEHKDIHIEHEWVRVPMTHLNIKNFQFSETLPIPHPGAIPTPPPNSPLS